MSDLHDWRQQMRRALHDEREAWALDILARADANEPPGSPGPGQVELALDTIEETQKDYGGDNE